jgi:hypothetical protein
MIVFFGFVALLGLLLVVFDFTAMSVSTKPRLYTFGVSRFGFLMMLVGVVGAACVWAFGFSALL